MKFIPANDAVDVANYVLKFCETYELGQPTSLHLYQILFYIEKEIGIRFNRRFIIDGFETGKYGMWVPSVYYHFMANGSLPLYSDKDFDSNNVNMTEDERRVLSKIIQEKTEMSLFQILGEIREDPVFKRFYNKEKHVYVPYEEIIKST